MRGADECYCGEPTYADGPFPRARSRPVLAVGVLVLARTIPACAGPPFVAISDRVIRYSGADVMEYLSSRRIDPKAA
ncbi:hypothetical protein [Nocardia sp. NPDC047038]|uniref:hypothetical protein n=1 Tax=Nocardia sp. NPDC047038 TaxID=3154338 RepID=UPI0033DDEB44